MDFDATDDAVHSKQESRFFHGYYDHYCFLPLYVFCRDQLLISYLRPTRLTTPNMPGLFCIAGEMVKESSLSEILIIFRGGSGF